ncbi:MAG: hypothetical protein E7566_00770 [Ruminococcaceae bacterium]|nr:hypothetical protein [Oscillospiraceae bacterium]
MKIVRNPALKENKKPFIAMIIIAILMLVLPFTDFSLLFRSDGVEFYPHPTGVFTAVLSIIPITWITSILLLMKTKKISFAKMPAYVICALLALGYIIFFIAAGDNTVIKLLGFSIIVLAIYPFIIATLTLEGRMYNRVFATLFTSILIGVSIIGVAVLSIISAEIRPILLFPMLTYIELLLIVLVYTLEKPAKKLKKEEVNKITH